MDWHSLHLGAFARCSNCQCCRDSQRHVHVSFQLYLPDLYQLLLDRLAICNRLWMILSLHAGNEAVLRARFEDAQFFYNKDRQHRLESFRPQLRTTTFQQGLGSMLDKSERVEQLVGLLGSLTNQSQGLSLHWHWMHSRQALLTSSCIQNDQHADESAHGLSLPEHFNIWTIGWHLVPQAYAEATAVIRKHKCMFAADSKSAHVHIWHWLWQSDCAQQEKVPKSGASA